MDFAPFGVWRWTRCPVVPSSRTLSIGLVGLLGWDLCFLTWFSHVLSVLHVFALCWIFMHSQSLRLVVILSKTIPEWYMCFGRAWYLFGVPPMEVALPQGDELSNNLLSCTYSRFSLNYRMFSIMKMSVVHFHYHVYYTCIYCSTIDSKIQKVYCHLYSKEACFPVQWNSSSAVRIECPTK